MAKLTPKEKMEMETQNLIKQITDISEEEENFEICERFCLSNLFYHKFLDPDESKINKVLTGVHQKFLIHTQPDKAAVLQSLVQKYQDSGHVIRSLILLLSLLLSALVIFSLETERFYFWIEEIK